MMIMCAILVSVNTCLFVRTIGINLCCEDAQTKSQKSSVGIILDEAQKTIISESFRSEKPDKLSCFKDSYRNDFPE